MKCFIILCLFLFGSCKEDTEPALVCSTPCIDCEEEGLKVVWQKELSPDFEECWSMPPILYRDRVLFSDYLCGVPEKVKSYDSRNGDLYWEWEDYLIPRLLNYGNGIYLTEEILSLSADFEVYSIDLSTGKNIWSHDFGDTRGRTSVIGEMVYVSTTSEGLDYDKNQLVRSNLEYFDKEIILEFERRDGYRPGIEPPVLYIHPTNKDSILIFQNRQYNFALGDDKVDIAAYNMAQDTFLWYMEDLTPTGNSGIFPPIVEGDIIYFQGEGTILCINALEGKVIWQQQTNNGYTGCPILLEKGMIIAKGINREIHAFDGATGAIIWHKKEIGANVESMAIYKDRIYYGSKGDGALRCLDLYTGELLWIETSPNRKDYSNADFVGGVAINEELGYLYTHDGYFAMCIDLNE